MSQVSINQIPEDTLSAGLSPKVNDETMIYHIYPSPNFTQSTLDTIIKGKHLDIHANLQQTNRGQKSGNPYKCRNCKVEIEIGQPMIRLTKQETIEYDYGMDKGTRPIWRSWIFGNEDCLIEFLDENDLEWIL